MRLFASLLVLCLASLTSAVERDVWIGTKTGPGGPSRGVYHLTLDDTTGNLSPATLVAEVDNPGWVTRHPSLPVLYTTRGEEIVAWRIERDGDTMRLEEMNAQPTGDGGACHIALDKTARVLFSAQYGGGSVCSYRLNEDGSLDRRVTHLEHSEGSRADDLPPFKHHPHWVGVTADNQILVVPDLGRDRLYLHRLNAATGELAKRASVQLDPKSGPRHFKFHPTLPVAYLLNELSLSVAVLDWKHHEGNLVSPRVRQTIPTLSETQKAGETHNSGSEIRVHPSGKFVYSANRGHDSITAFAVDQATGELSLIEVEPIRGGWPRNFNVDPSGRWLLAAGRDSNTLAVFAIDPETGALQYTREMASVPAPICVHIE